MKSRIVVSACTFLTFLACANLGWSQGATNFGMVGITEYQTLQLNLVAIGAPGCVAELSFQNSAGKPVGSTMNANLAPGQSVSLSLNGNTLVKRFGQRVELLPVVSTETTYPPVPCRASAEVVENLLSNTSALAAGAVSWPPQPIFGMLGLTVFQTVRLNVVASPPNPCMGTLSFTDSAGNAVGRPMSVSLNPGQATFLDLPGTAAVTSFGQRAEVLPTVTLSPDTGPNACVASNELYTTLTGETAVYLPAQPCSPSDASCVAF